MNIHTYVRIIVIVLITIFSTTADAQSRKKTQKQVAEPSFAEQILKQYSDSIITYKHNLDSITHLLDSLREADGCAADNKYYKFFSPLNFYHSSISKQFQLNGDTTNAVDKALMNVYFKRPDLIRTTDSKLFAVESAKPSQPSAQEPQKIELTKLTPIVVKKEEPVAPKKEAELDLYVAKPHFWTFTADYFLQFLQNHVSENWHKGGSDSYSMLGTVTFQYNYNNKQKLKWDNKLEMKLGMQTMESDTVNKFKSTEDLLRYTSKLGLQAHKDWYYTMQLIANTQFAQGRKDNKRNVYSDFMSPFNLNISVGMDYTYNSRNKKFTSTVHLAPIAFNFKYVGRKDLAKNFGINTGHRTLEDFGSTFTADFTWKPTDMLKWKARLYGYTTYHKYEMEFENTITFTFSRFISANIFLHPRFDDSVKRKEDNNTFWQFKEYLSFGFSYSM